MSITGLLGNDAVLTLLATVVAALWSVITASKWWQGLKDDNYAKAVACVEGGVQVAMQTYVAALKEANADGKLTKEEEAEARKKATDAAIAFGKSRGVDVVAELGTAYIQIWIEKIIAKLKGTPKMPDDVAALLP